MRLRVSGLSSTAMLELEISRPAAENILGQARELCMRGAGLVAGFRF